MFSGDYDSSFEDNDNVKKRKCYEVYDQRENSYKGETSKETFSKPERNYECGMDEYRKYFASFNAFERHKILINQYLLYHPGATTNLKRDSSRDKTDFDIIRANHQFLWEENESIETWGKKIAKKYYDKLFKEYCICDLSKYKDGQVGMRWRIEKEVIDGKGQFICGEKRCFLKENIRTWEMNFGYIEGGVKKNALIKLRLCHDCSYKLNYKHRRKEIKKPKSKALRDSDYTKGDKKKKQKVEEEEKREIREEEEEKSNIWKEPPKVLEEKNKEEEFEEYLQDLLL